MIGARAEPSRSLFTFLSFLAFGGKSFDLTLLQLCILLLVHVDVEDVVNGAVPLLASLVNRVLERNSGFFLADAEEECLFDKRDVRLVELIQASHQHQDKQVDEDVRILSDLEEGLTGQLFECFFEVVRREALLALVLPATSILALILSLWAEEELKFFLRLRCLLDFFRRKLVTDQCTHGNVIGDIIR